ncbi:MAG TPA: T9SS type A sorting domain-containing protein, partial [Bacteroidetes bacterium]|nr:T9SS type A sorting domain-containing protein [Bacteroidota bacterium]
MDIYFSISSSNSDTETVNFSPALASGEIDTLSFATGADLSTFGSYTVTSGVILSNDSNATNNSKQVFITNTQAKSLNLFSDFDNSTIGASSIIDSIWTSTGATTYLWEVGNGSTLSSSTGPDGDKNGSGNYVYTEASCSNCDGELAELSTGCISFMGASKPTLDFYYHKYGSVIGDLYIELFNNVGWQTIDTIVGQTDTSITDPWNFYSIDLSSYSNQNVQIRFVGQRGTGTNSFYGDIALDEIRVYNKLAKDAEISSIDGPGSQCTMSSTENISISFVNLGSDTIAQTDISYWVDSGSIFTESITLNTPIGFGESYSYTFNTTADFSIVGNTYTIGASINLLGDSNLLNDTIYDSLTHITPISFPYTNDFDHVIAGMNGAFDADWTALPDDGGFMWQSNKGITGTSSTGPKGDHTSGTGTYLYTEASSGMTGDTAELISTCIELPATGSPIMSFYYHFYGQTIGGLYIEIFYNNQWETIDSIIGQQQTIDVDPWEEKLVSLIPYIGNVVNLRLIAIRGTSITGDMAIDDIYIFDAPSIDMGILSINAPESGCGLESSTTISGTVKNVGFSPLSSFDASYTLFGNTVNETIQVIPSIGFGESYDFSFNTTADLSSQGMTYKFNFIVSLNGDTNSANDSLLNYGVTHYSAIATPYAESFDNIVDGIYGMFDMVWTGDPATSSSYHWESSVGGTSSSGTGPNGDHLTGSGTFLYTEASSGTTGSIAYLTSSCVDIGSMTTPAIGFWYHKYGTDMGDLYIEVQDAGQWVTLDSIIGQTHTSETSPWIQKVIDLQSFIGKSIAIRFKAVRGINYTGDMAIDDFQIFDLPDTESELNEIISPFSKCELDFGLTEAVSIKIKNNGAVAVDSIYASYIYNNDTVSELFVLNPALSSTDDTILVFNSSISISGIGTHNISAYIELMGDLVSSNDTISKTFESFTGGGLTQTISDNIPIPDGDLSGVMIPVNVCGLPSQMDSCFYLKRLTIDNLVHTWLSDIDIYLISAAGDTLEVSTDNGGSGSNMMSVSFTIDATANITSQTSGILAGDYKTEEKAGFAKFHNTNPNGIWHLWVLDDVSSDVGTLYGFTMEFHNDKPDLDLGKDTILCSWALITLDAGFGNQSYLWQDGSTNSTFVIDASSLDSTTTHNFNVSITDIDGCTNYDEVNIQIDNCAGINDVSSVDNNFSVYPNPAEQMFTIIALNNISSELAFQVYNIQGQMIDSKKLDYLRKGSNIQWSVGHWPEGIYYLNITSNEGNVLKRISIMR